MYGGRRTKRKETRREKGRGRRVRGGGESEGEGGGVEGGGREEEKSRLADSQYHAHFLKSQSEKIQFHPMRLGAQPGTKETARCNLGVSDTVCALITTLPIILLQGSCIPSPFSQLTSMY